MSNCPHYDFETPDNPSINKSFDDAPHSVVHLCYCKADINNAPRDLVPPVRCDFFTKQDECPRNPDCEE